MVQNEAGLFITSAVYGLGFTGIIPAYVLAIRDLYPSREASWRIPIMLLTGMTGMAVAIIATKIRTPRIHSTSRGAL